MLKDLIRTFLTPVAQNAVHWEKILSPKVQKIKPELFLSALATSAPHFHFLFSLPCFHCSCCFSCCSTFLWSCWSLCHQQESKFPFHWGGGQHSCTLPVVLPLHCLTPVILLFLGFFTHMWHFLFWEDAAFPSFGRKMNADLTRMLTCMTLKLTTQLSR